MTAHRPASAPKPCPSIASLPLLALVATLAGCGGGGGGGSSGGGGGGGGGGGTQTGITVSPTTLSFTANHDDPEPPPAQTVTVTAHDPGTTWLMFEGGSSSGIACNNTTSCTIQVRPPNAPSSFVTPGTTTNGVTLLGCADAMCVSGGQRGRVSITYTYTVTPGFDIQPATVPTVFGVEGVQTPPLLLTLTNPSGTVKPLYVLNQNLGNPVFATVTPPPGAVPSGTTLEVRFANNLPVGNYTGTLEVQSGGSTRFTRRTINYVVGSAYQLSGNTSFVIDSTTTAAALNQTVRIGSGAGASFQWTATETAPWLLLSRTSGDTSTQNDIGLSLLPGVLEHVPAGIHRATVTIRPPPAMPPPTPTALTFDVVLDMRLPLVEFAMPGVVVAGVGGDAYIKGSGLNSAPSTVSFGGTAATTVNRESATLIRATYPATLASGSHPVDIGLAPNALNLDRQHAVLVVVDPGTVPPASIPSSGTKYAALYDDERRALYVANTGNETIERYSLNGTWTADSPLPIPKLRDIALAPGGGPLLALSESALSRVDPVAWSVLDSLATPASQSNIPNRTFGAGVDGEFLIARSDEISMYSPLLRYQPFPGSFVDEPLGCCAVGRYIRPSGDGSVLYMSINLGPLGASVHRYVVRARQTEGGMQSPAPGQRGLSVSRDGNRFLLDATRVYTGTLGLFGEVSAANVTLSAGVITTDGTRVYAYSDAPTPSLYAFDLTAPNGGGFLPLPGSPHALPDSVGAEPVMTASIDGKTVFIAGSSRVIIKSVP